MFVNVRFLQMLAVISGVFLMNAGAIHAQSQDDDRLDEAWKDAMEETEGVLTPKQYATLNGLAYQAAVTRVCDGYELADQKYAKAVNELVATGIDNLKDEEVIERHSAILFALGTSYGLFLAEGNANKDDFCAGAKEFKETDQSAHLWQ